MDYEGLLAEFIEEGDGLELDGMIGAKSEVEKIVM